MITIIFESHSTTFDNEQHLASGWNDVDLSPLGLEQSQALGERHKDALPDAVYCADLQRSYKTAAIAFKNTSVPIYVDERLRECNYGDLTQQPKSEVKPQDPRWVDEPFPNGECYRQTSKRMKSFLDDLKNLDDGTTVMVIGSRATQYGLEEHIKNKKLEDVVTAPWAWQPGWEYAL